MERGVDVVVVREPDLSELQRSGAASSLRVVNLCGRQRMLCQRLAKLALLAEVSEAWQRLLGCARRRRPPAGGRGQQAGARNLRALDRELRAQHAGADVVTRY